MNNIRERSPIRLNNEFNSDSSDVEDIENIINITMANVSQVEMNMAKDMLPEYSGGSKNLAYFIKQVEMYIELLRKPEENCIFNRLLFEKVKSKLTGEARDVLISSNCNRWSELKEELLQRFGDPRSEELLAHDLNTCYQIHNQSYEQYYEIIKHKLQILLEHVSIRTPNRDIRISKENMYVQQALSTFKAGILEPYCSHLLNLPVNSLEQALYECRKFDNDKAQISFMNFMRQKSKPNNLLRKSNLPPTRPPQNFHNYKNYTSFFARPFLNNQQSTPQATQNNNIFRQNNAARNPALQPRQPQQNFNNNSLIRRNNNSQQYQPTPMSISTRNTYRPPQNNAAFAPQSRPTFVSEELYNIERHSNNPTINIPTQENYHSDNYNPAENFNETSRFSENDEYNHTTNGYENFREVASETTSI